MALEVARAYDENKNLVPLYIATDSDPVYEPVTPGFIWTFDNYGSTNSPDLRLIITSNALNPTGGELDFNSSAYNNFTTNIDKSLSIVHISVYNESGFDIIVNFNIGVYYYVSQHHGSSYTFLASNINVSANNSVLDAVQGGDTYTAYMSTVYKVGGLTVQRVL